MTNGSGSHKAGGKKTAPAKSGSTKRKPAAEMLKKGVKRPKGPTTPGTGG